LAKNPTEAASQRPVPDGRNQSRAAHSKQLIATISRDSGLNPFHTPLGVMLDERNGRIVHAIRMRTGDGYPCLVNAKATRMSVALCSAQHPNVPGNDAKVTSLEGRIVREVLG